MESCKSRRAAGHRLWATTLAVVAATASAARAADDVAALRLVPFPKEIRFEAGELDLSAIRALEAPADRLPLLKSLLADELRRAGLKLPAGRPIAQPGHVLRWIGDGPAVPAAALRDRGSDEEYTLRVAPGGVAVVGRGPAGLLHGVQTLVQLLRANRRGHRLPCLAIRDWPSLRWRCFQNDMTRGPSATLETLRQQVALGSLLKMNLFTYYMESQYRFAKHPEIGPPDGSLQPDELRRLVEYARPLGLEILGNQQSFGHLSEILKHEQFAGLRETPAVITPMKEETYRLLDDLYSEVCPLLPLEFFNVCCDETWGLGTGPSKELAAKIGEGGVYVRHMRRVHDLLATKYHKRMMMWGDIILLHPADLDKIPKDTVMLTWEYGAAADFERHIMPFARSGYEFFVCPGTSDWNRVLPDFGYAEINIRNFVRDGAKHGALGMLNTTWKDDGESLNAPNWHGYAWGAECAWNASATEPADFNRRIGAVLFGENGDHFGRAIDLLAQVHRRAGTFGLMNRRFWENDFLARRDPALARRQAERWLALAGPAIEHLRACRQQATVHADLLDALLLGAQRMETIAHRSLDAVEVAGLYQAAYDGRPEDAAPLLAKAEGLVRRSRDAHEALGRRFAALWLTENKPYFLDRTVKRYAAFVAALDRLAERLAAARRTALAGKALPAPEDFGLVAGALARRARPQTIAPKPLDPAAAWEEPTATHRLAMVVGAGSAPRSELPVELDVRLPPELSRRPVRAFCSIGTGPAGEILAQVDPLSAAKSRLMLLLPGPLPKGSRATVRVYLGLARPPRALPGAVTTRDAEHGMKWIENDRVRLLLGPEGGHVYRWEVKALGDRSLTMPGQTSWHGFADVSDDHRSTPNALRCTAAGPALVRYCCTDDRGLAKTVSLFGSVAWMEVVLSEPVTRYWDFDNPANFCADGATPGRYLFSNGAAGAVGRQADGVRAQVRTDGVFWAVKHNAQGLTLGMVAPDGPVRFVIAPGSGAGGVGIENSPPAAHFVTYGGLLPGDPKAVMEGLRGTLDFRTPPTIALGALQACEEAPR